MTSKALTGAAAIVLLLSTSAAAASHHPTTPCPTPKLLPAGELSPWASPVTMVAVSEPAGLGGSKMQVDQARDLALYPMGALRLPAPAGRDGGHGGLAAITITKPGIYRVALSSAAWADLVRDGQTVASVAHGHGPACTTVRKIVDFSLTPGRYTLQLSGNAEARIVVLVARKP